MLLDGATERVSGKLTANYGSVLIRGNNVLFIRVGTAQNPLAPPTKKS